MKKTRMLSTMAVAFVVVGTVPATSGNLATHFAMFDMDSPITVSDGSIHGYIRGLNLKHWVKKTEHEVYTVEAADLDYITFEGFTDESGAAPPSPLTDTGGWRITISNGTPVGENVNRDSIAFCSTARELPSPACMLGTPGGDKWVYLETHPKQNGNWNEHYKTLDFHDTRTGCEGGVCDHILYITIETVNRYGVSDQKGRRPLLPGPTGHTYTCDKVDKCSISVG
jgi:hypothetical protein